MSAPINVSAATAVQIGWGSLTQDALESTGPNYDLWFKYTGKTDELLIGWLALGLYAADVYRVRTSVYQDDGVTPVFGLTNKTGALMIPVSAGVTIRIRAYISSGTPDIPLQVSVLPAPGSSGVTIPANALMINDDGAFEPAAFIDPDTGAVLGYKTSTFGEGMESLPNGIKLLTHESSDEFVIYGTDMEPDATVALTLTGLLPTVSSDRSSKFYINDDTSTSVGTITKVSATGTIESTWAIDTHGSVLKGAAPSRNNTKLYYITATGAPIRVWDLVGNVELANLVAVLPIAGGIYGYLHDVLVLDDGSVIVAAVDSSDGSTKAFRYSAAGALLNSYDVKLSSDFENHITHGVTNNSFIVWLVQDGGNSQEFIEIRVSDGVHLRDVTSPVFYGGVNFENVSSAMARFGSYESCSVTTLNAPITLPKIVPHFATDTITAEGDPIVPDPIPDGIVDCCAKGTISTPQANVEEPVIVPDLIAICIGDGLVPEGGAGVDGPDNWS